MSRKSALQTLTASGLFNPSTKISPSSLVNETSPPRNPYVLQDEVIPGKTPYTRRHHGKSSGLVSGSTGGGGKNGRNGGKNGIGGNQGKTDNDEDSSSSQDDEDSDDDEGDEEDEEEEPAVSGPVCLNGNDDTASVGKSFMDHPSKATIQESLQRGFYQTGSGLRKRSFSVAMEDDKSKYDEEDENEDDSLPKFDAENETGDESDYPRKRVATEISSTNGSPAYHSGPPSVATMDTNLYDLDDLGNLDDLDDEDVEDEEESALIQDFEANEDRDTSTDLKTPDTTILEYGDEDPNEPGLITAEGLEDLDNEVFGVGWGDPNAFHDIELANDFASFSDPFADIQLECGLFPENGSEISGPDFTTPFDTPNYTPRGSFSTAILSGPSSPENAGGSESDEDDLAELTPYFERDDPVLKHIVSTQGKGMWADDSDDDHGLWKHFFSEDEEGSNEELEMDTENASEEEEGSETDEGETTDEEEDLPMPTPRSKSMLRRASISSISSSRPQVVHFDNSSSGPKLASWVADPNRTICVIDGSKKTFLLPGGAKGYEFGGTGVSQLMLEESESERSSIQTGYDPSMSSLNGDNGFFLNESDILGAPDAFYGPFNIQDMFDLADLDEDLITNDDGIDEYEQQIADFLDFSTDEADGELCDGISDGAYDEGEDDDECIGAVENSETMLARWDQVAVTSFRKRQIQHAQGSNHLNNPATPHKISDRRLSQTITPARKKKVKSRYMINKGAGSSAGVKVKATNRKNGTNIGTGSQWNVLDM